MDTADRTHAMTAPAAGAQPAFVSHDARDWDMYTSMEGAEQAGERITLAVNQGLARFFHQLGDGVQPVVAWGELATSLDEALKRESRFGACDGETARELDGLLEHWVPRALRRIGAKEGRSPAPR